MRTRVEERTFFSWEVKERLLKETGGKCAHCGTPLDRYTNLTVDHFIPLNRGGTNDTENLTVLCEECNRLKSDMILPPVVWYGYLSINRRKELAKYLAAYMKETDYLAEDCLIPLDTFRIEVPITTKKIVGCNKRIIRMPVFLCGTRMERDDAFAWLSEYRRSLLFRDSCGTLEKPEDFNAPCYLIKKGSIDIAMVNPWMIHEWDASLKNYRNEVIMDWFFTQDLPDRDYLPEMLACMASGVEKYITGSMGQTTEGASVVLFRMRCFLSDRFCKPVFDILAAKQRDDIVEFNTGYSLTARIRELSAFRILGSRRACNELEKMLRKDLPDGATMHDMMKWNQNLNKRFRESSL